jgi:hypothetical protein
MTEELIRPIDAETAKAISDAAQLGSKIVDAGSGVGQYVRASSEIFRTT